MNSHKKEAASTKEDASLELKRPENVSQGIVVNASRLVGCRCWMTNPARSSSVVVLLVVVDGVGWSGMGLGEAVCPLFGPPTVGREEGERA